MKRVSAYLCYARASAAVAVRYRTALLTQVALLLVQVFVLTRLWHALYGTHNQEEGLSVHSTVVYLTVTNLQTLLMSTSVAGFVSYRVRQGSVATDLARPLGFVGQMLAWHSGKAIVLLCIDLALAPVAMLVGGFGAPPSPAYAAWYILLLVTGWALNAFIATLIGLSALWLVQVFAVSAIVRLSGQFLGGIAVPLVFFPGLLRNIADALPFQFLGYVPAAAYVGGLSDGRILRDVGVASVWVVVLGASIWAVERRARRKLTVAGG